MAELFLKFEDRVLQELLLSGGTVTIGRQPDNVFRTTTSRARWEFRPGRCSPLRHSCIRSRALSIWSGYASRTAARRITSAPAAWASTRRQRKWQTRGSESGRASCATLLERLGILAQAMCGLARHARRGTLGRAGAICRCGQRRQLWCGSTHRARSENGQRVARCRPRQRSGVDASAAGDPHRANLGRSSPLSGSSPVPVPPRRAGSRPPGENSWRRRIAGRISGQLFEILPGAIRVMTPRVDARRTSGK